MKHCIGAQQELVCIYQNDFSKDNCMDRINVVFGEMRVSDGALRTVGSTGHSTALLELTNGESFVLEMDFLSHQSGGGIVFGGTAGGARASTPENDRTNGYYAYISSNGTQGMIGATNHAGRWIGNFSASKPDRIEKGTDLRLRLRVSGDHIIYTVTDINSGCEVYRCEHKKSEGRFDFSPYDTGTIALRLDNDGGVGGISNIKLYTEKEAVMSDVTLGVSQKLSAKLRAQAHDNKIVFAKEGQGFAFSYDASVERLVVYRYLHGKTFFAAQHAMCITSGREYDLSVVNRGDGLAFYFGSDKYPVIEVHSKEPTEYSVGATDKVEVTVEDTVLYSGKTYTNPVTYGADPEILYHDGVFYLYTLDRTPETCRVRVRSSLDMIEWHEAGFAFEIDEDSPIDYFMSPNVFFSDGWFYLLIASQFSGGYGAEDFRVFYASARSPLGPFVMNKEKPYVNTEAEIGGAPFVDDDGKVYMTTVRFGGGNHVYIQELEPKDGVLSKKSEAHHCYSPTEHYEIDEYGSISEGGVIIKHNGYYYMMFASGHFRGRYGESYGISRNIFGPYEKYKYNEVLVSNTYADGVGDCMVVVCPELDEIFVTYHRHASIGNCGYDRDICIDRVYFVPDENGGPDVLRIYGPTTLPTPAPKWHTEK